MVVGLWVLLIFVAGAVLATMVWATIRWFREPGARLIASFFRNRSRDAGGSKTR
jgi:hypothetical protein